MKLIIDIDEEIYESIKIGMRNRDDMVEIGEAVENGTPFEQISDEVNKLKKVSDGNKVYVGINDVLDIIDKYKAESEE